MRKSFLLLALGLLMAVSAQAKTYDLTTYSKGRFGQRLTLISGDTLQGKMQEDMEIRVLEGATVFLNGVIIQHNGNKYMDDNHSGIECNGHAVISIVEGSTNYVNDLSNFAIRGRSAIYVPAGKNLIIEGKGTLYATSHGAGAAIGAGWEHQCGNIEIRNCTIIAICESSWVSDGTSRVFIGSAGIGASCKGKCGNITITNANINATGGYGAAGIGGGGLNYPNCSGIGGSCGRVQIDGGSVVAKGGAYAPAIGSGIDNSCEKISVSIPTKKLIAYPGPSWDYALGNGRDGKCGYINIGGDIIEKDDPVLTYNPFTYPSCFTPQNVTSSLVQDESAFISWQPGFQETHWEVKYAKHYGGLGAHSFETNKTSVQLDNLAPSTAYDVWVRSECGVMDYSDWTPVYTFTTKDAPNECSAPFILGVSTTCNSATVTWTKEDMWHYNFELCYSRADNDAGYFSEETKNTSFTLTDLEPETEYEVWVRGYCSGMLKPSDNSAKYRFKTDPEPSCPAPEGVQISNVSQTSAYISWNRNTEWAGIRIKWGKSNESSRESTEQPAGAYAFEILDLEPGNSYIISISSFCDNGKESEVADYYITTQAKPEEQPEPTGLYVAQEYATSAIIAWDIYQEFGYVQVRYKKKSENTWSDPVTPGKNMYYYSIDNLDPETEYEASIRGSKNASSGLQSEWVEPVTFTTLKKKQSCQTPSDFLKYGNPDFYSQALIWRVIEGQNEWLVSYKTAEETAYQVREVTLEDVEIIQSNGHDYYEFILDNLASATEYKVKMRTLCGDDESGYTNEYTFNTKTCGTPTELQCSYDKFSYSQILLWWQPATGTKKWFVAYREKGFDGAFLTQEADINSFSLENLAPGTEYEIHVVAECGEYNYSEESNTIYASTKACLAPTITLIESLETSATISWEKNANQPYDWDVQYKEGSETYYPGGITYEVSGSAAQYTATNLKPGTSYIAHVRCACDRDNYVYSDWSAEELFTTTGETGLEEISTKFEGSVKVLRDGQLFILRDGKLFNAQGQEVK